MIRKKRLIRLTRQLIKINSENPGGNESMIAGFVKFYLHKLGVDAKIYEFRKGRSNVIAYLRGRDKKYSLLITPHLDTVPAGKNWDFSPFSGALRGGRIYGLGATDCKGNLAVGLETINSLVEDRAVLDYNLIFAATANEESGSDFGLVTLLDKAIVKPDVALVLDSEEFEVIVAQKGLMHLKVNLEGIKAHGAYPQKGINAINNAVDILHELKARSPAYKKNKYLNAPTMNIGTIKGGDKVNVVADWCEFELDFRFLPGESHEKILTELKQIIKKYAKKFKIEISGLQNGYSINETHPLVRNFVAALKKLKIKHTICGSEGATTITFFQDKNIPAIATGFGSQGRAHTVNEYVKADNLYKGALVLEEFLKSYTFEKEIT